MKNSLLKSVILFTGFSLAAWSIHAGIAFPNPPGGWTYIFNGDQAIYGPHGEFSSLDGTWSHDNGSDQWDGSQIGGTFGPGNGPGGVNVITEGGVTYLRIQDTGDPRDYGYPDPSNRKIYLGHDISAEGASDTVMDDGITLSFRARIPTSGPLDPLHRDGQQAAGIQPYPPEGDGYVTSDSGKGNFVIKQGSGGAIAFSLTTTNDSPGGAPTPRANFAGLTMNEFNGNQVTANVNFGQGTATNLVPFNPTNWHELWIVLRKDPAGIGTHQAFIFVDGNPKPYLFKMTAGTGSDYSGISYLAIGSTATPQNSGLDIDFMAVKIGAEFPPGAVDNLPPEIKDVIPASGATFYPAANGISFTATTLGTNSLLPSGMTLTLNGVNVSSALSVGGTAQYRMVTYKELVRNTAYQGELIVADQAGRAETNKLSFDTFVEADLKVIEAEDFNYEGGKFIDNPVLSSMEAPNNYINKVGLQNVDRFDPSGSGTHTYRSYDPNTQIGEMVGTDITTAPEPLRQKFLDAQAIDPGVTDYYVGWVDLSEWWNYTRTFPDGKYRVYARLARDGTAPFIARMDKVISGATTANQVLAPIGMMQGRGTGGWQRYLYFPVVDVTGKEVIVPLSGVQTLRFALVSGGLNANFYVLVPITDVGALAPYVATASPAPDATGLMPDEVINLAITDRDTKVETGTVELWVNGSKVNASVTARPSGATVFYQPPAFWPLGSTNTLKLIFSDNGTPATSITNEWRFVTVASIPTIPAAFAKPLGSGQERGFTARVVQTANTDNTTARTEDQLAGWIQPIIGAAYATPQTINWNQNPGASAGNFPNDDPIPGIPGPTDSTDGIAAEIIAYLELNRGVYAFGVNSDDGFRLTVGSEAREVTVAGSTSWVLLGEYNGGRSAANSEFSFLVETNGLYPFRLTWEEGSGDAVVELYSIDRATGTRTLINDPAAPNAVKAYRYNTALATPVTLTRQPTNATAFESRTATFSVAPVSGSITNPWMFAYQWQENGFDLPGANGPSYTTPSLTVADNGKTYGCQIYLPGFRPVLSSTATLTVVADTVPPKVVFAGGAKGSPLVNVVFDEIVEPTAAAQAANYTISGATVTNAVLAPTGGKTVVLGVSGLTTNATLTINGIIDQVGNAMVNVTVPVASTVLAVNFQRTDAPVPAGYLKDEGLVYADRGNGFNYGWDADNTANARWRQNPNSIDDRYDTFNHWQKPLPAGRVWEIAVPNGIYTVYLVGGESDNFDQILKTDVEGVLTVDGAATSEQRFFDAVATVTVSDGKLTVSNAIGASNNKVAFIEAYLVKALAVVGKFDSIVRQDGNVVITWSGGGMLQSADEVKGPWTDVASATSPLTLQPTATQKFYRLRSN